MKKQKLAALFLVALLTLSSCGKSASKNSSNQKTEPETTTEKLSTTTEASSEVIEEPTTADNTEVISDDGTASDAEQTSSDITLYDYNSSTGVFRVGHRYTQIPFDWVPRKDKNGNTNLFLINNDERRIVHFITQKERPAEQDQTVIDTYKKSLDKLAIDIKIKYEEQAYYADTLYHTICFYGTINGHYTAGLSEASSECVEM